MVVHGGGGGLKNFCAYGKKLCKSVNKAMNFSNFFQKIIFLVGYNLV